MQELEVSAALSAEVLQYVDYHIKPVVIGRGVFYDIIVVFEIWPIGHQVLSMWFSFINNILAPIWPQKQKRISSETCYFVMQITVTA